MKKYYTLLLLFIICITNAQNGITYQAVILNPNSEELPGVDNSRLPLVNQSICLEFKIVNASSNIDYQETITTKTDDYGMVNVIIGTGTRKAGIASQFSAINWDGSSKNLIVSLDPIGRCSNFIEISNQPFTYVPYALYAANAGATGAQGPQGIQGIAGPAGATGPQGITGANGTNGNDGLSAYQIWLNEGNTGTEAQFLTALRGATGAQGPQGIQGAQGAAGPQGTAGINGTNGSNGIDGLNAYQIWLNAGNTGTEAQFLTALRGATGATGILSNGTTAGNTPYWNGSQWVINNSNVFNNGNGIGIGTSNPNTSAKLEISSSTQGFLPPRMTTAQRDAIVSPALGLIVFNTSTNCLNFYVGSGWNETCGTVIQPAGSITTITCGSATNSGTLTQGTVASGVSSSVPYTGGNGGIHNGQIINSTGVTGLTATLSAGNFNTGIGTLIYTISGTPNINGTASFILNIGGQTCTLSISVANNLFTQYTAGSVFCNSGATAIVDVTNPNTGKTWMDRDLGASQAAISNTDINSYGDLYQWGRGNDGHQCRNSATTTILSTSDQPGNGDFIIISNTPFDWRSTQNDDLWQGVNGTNNPCPNGYRVPTATELDNERLSWSSNNTNGAFASPLKLPMGGRRGSNGTISNIGNASFYWCNTVYGVYTNFLVTTSSGTSELAQYGRAPGHSVRCIKN